MNKKLLILLPVAMLTLAGCNQEGGTPGEEGGPLTKDLVINRDVIVAAAGMDVNAKYTYPQGDYAIQLDEYEFHATSGVGIVPSILTSSDNDGTHTNDYYWENGIMQWRKQGHDKGPGLIENETPFTCKQIKVEFYYRSTPETAEYIPYVFAKANEEDDFGVKLTAKEGTSINGTLMDGKQDSYNSTSKTWYVNDVYKFVATFDVSGNKYFQVAAASGVGYVGSVTFVA